MTVNFFTLLTAISLFITIVLALFFFVNKRGYVPENRLLAVLLVVFNLQVFYSFTTSFYASEFFLAWHKPLFILRQTSLLIGPLIWFYINAFLKRKELSRRNVPLHFLPFILVSMWLVVYLQRVDNFILWRSPLDLYTTILILGQNLVYILLSLRSLRTKTTGFRDLFRSLLHSSQNRWLQILLIGFILIWIVNLNSFALYMILRRPGWCAYTGSIYALTVFLFINTIMFALLLRPDLYFIVTKYKSTKVTEPDKAGYLHRLQSFMEEQKPYLDPDITLERLAKDTGIPPRLLSQIINETWKKNFKGFILEYRIRESMKILADSRHAKLTILEVLYQVGFNSKSAFNNQFKIYTNQTPIEFRSRAVGVN
jgi:AraC-like DNA-binding protein